MSTGEPEQALADRTAPRQERARRTVERILDATLALLAEVGYDRLSTNLVARRAGVAVGTLYRYFADKEALLRALVRRQAHEELAVLRRTLAELGPETSLEEGVRRLVAAFVAAHQVDPGRHRLLAEQVPRLGDEDLFRDVDAAAAELLERFLRRHADRIVATPPQVLVRVVMTAVEAVTHRALVLEPGSLPPELLEPELVRLVLGYLTERS